MGNLFKTMLSIKANPLRKVSIGTVRYVSFLLFSKNIFSRKQEIYSENNRNIFITLSYNEKP